MLVSVVGIFKNEFSVGNERRTYPVVVLIDSFQPTHVIMGMADDVNIEHALDRSSGGVVVPVCDGGERVTLKRVIVGAIPC